MKLQKKNNPEEKRVLTGMIVDASVCGRLAARWTQGGLFRNKWANLVGQWCVDFHGEYDAAPGASIEGMFDAWAGDESDEDTVALVEKFIAGLSDEYEEIAQGVNADYLVDLAGKYFNKVRLEKLVSEMQGDIDAGRADEAAKRVDTFTRVELGTGHSIDPLADKAAVKKAFEMKTDPVVQYPGALGEFYGDNFERDGFVGFMGATGRGKSWWLQDVAWRGLLQRRRVAFFEVGDMSEAQILRRFMVRASRHPMAAGAVNIPTLLEREGSDGYQIEFKEKTFIKGLDYQTAWAAMDKRTKAGKGLLKLSCHPNSSVNVAGIASELLMWERQGWVPDIVVVDYADILAPPAGVVDSREQINHTWKQLRALSQSMHCCVVTATQSDADSYNAPLMGRRNFSDDRRKLDHVTGMVGINVSDAEKEDGVARLNWLKRREAEYTENRCVFVAGCLALASPAIRSAF